MLILLSLTDIILTLLLLSREGVEELNPFINYLLSSFGETTTIVVKVGITVICYFLLVWAEAFKVLHALTFLYTFLIIYEVVLLCLII